MAKKTKQVEEPKKPKYTKEEVTTGLLLLHQEYFMQTIGLLTHDTDHTELNYIKVPIQTPDGGLYLVSILHIEGPKVNLKALAAAGDAEEKKQAEKKSAPAAIIPKTEKN